MGARVLVVVGAAMVVAGLLWAAQGAGLFPYPARSFMVGRTPWVWYGLGFAAAGAAVVWASRRGGR